MMNTLLVEPSKFCPNVACQADAASTRITQVTLPVPVMAFEYISSVLSPVGVKYILGVPSPVI